MSNPLVYGWGKKDEMVDSAELMVDRGEARVTARGGQAEMMGTLAVMVVETEQARQATGKGEENILDVDRG